MGRVEPIIGHPAATANLDGETALVVADLHAGIEAALLGEGVSIDSRAEDRRGRLFGLVERTDPDRVVFLGDLMHAIGDPGGAERGEIEVLLDGLADRNVPATLVKGNHDGDIESWIDCEVTDGAGVRLGDVGFAHGHTWPARDVLDAAVVCVGHEHPAVRLEDEVGASRIEPAWLRGPLDPAAFADRGGAGAEVELVVFPSFNDLVGTTWVNVDGQDFLAPFLPAALPTAEAYLLDGTRLGDYRTV